MLPKGLCRIIYETLLCFIWGHLPGPFNGPWQDCLRCGQQLRMIPKGSIDEPGGEHWHRLESCGRFDRCIVCGLLVDKVCR